MLQRLILAVLFCLIYFTCEVDGQCKLADEGHMVLTYTDQYRPWLPLDKIRLHINDSHAIVVGIRACEGAHILLQKWRDNYRRSVYEVIIGGHNNKMSGIRKCAGCDFLQKVQHEVLHCNYINNFWISWCGDAIRVGKGYTIGYESQFLHVPMKSQAHFKTASIKSESDTHWAF